MKFDQFQVESWMTLHENDALYNLTDTCVSSLSIHEIEEIIGVSITDDLVSLKLDYGCITGSDRLKDAILSLYQSGTRDHITVTHGASHANELVIMGLLSPGDHVITLTPSYQQFYDLPKMLGSSYTLVALEEADGWQLHVEDVAKAINPQTKMIILNSPNNPTGTLLKEDTLRDLIRLARKHDLYILVDGIYRGLHREDTPEISDLYEKGIDAGGLAKIYSTAGLRIGWIKAQPEVIGIINNLRDYTMISAGPLTDYLACVILEHKEAILDRSRRIVNENKAVLKEYLKEEKRFSCVIPEDGSVAFMRYSFPMDSISFCETLLKETGIFFVPGSCFLCDQHVRFGFTNDPQITREGLKRLSLWLDEKGF